MDHSNDSSERANGHGPPPAGDPERHGNGPPPAAEPARRGNWLARTAVARPTAMLTVWWTVFGLLALSGIGVEDRLHRTNLQIDGTPSGRADELTREHFGNSNQLTVALKGSRSVIDRDGRALARRLDRIEDVSVLSPWTPGAARSLRPGPDRALLVVSARRSFDDVSRESVPDIRDALSDASRGPLDAHLTGYADISAGIEKETLSALQRAELIAAPLLMIILLFVFRSVVAAFVPLVLGLTTIGAARGVIGLANEVIALDAVALNLASMMGLALGVDYALLMVSRFREELDRGLDPKQATLNASLTAGRTVVFAGIALVAAMIVTYALAPGNVFASSAFGMLVAAVLSMLVAVTALPATLAFWGHRINSLSFGRGAGRESRAGLLAWRAVRRPALAAGIVLLLLIALALPTLALDTGPADPRLLPAANKERQDFQQVRDTLGGGWVVPYEIIFATDRGSMTEPERLAALDRWQRELIRDPEVDAVFGPAAIYTQTRELRELPRQLERASSTLASGRRSQRELANGLERARDGVDRLRSGLDEAASAARQLESGGATAAQGARRLEAGLATARSGAGELAGGLAAARRGAGALAEGSAAATRGARRLERGLERAERSVRAGMPDIRRLAAGLDDGASQLGQLQQPVQTAEEELARGLQALEDALPTTKVDPAYARAYEAFGTAFGAITGRHPITNQPVRPGYDGLGPSLTQAQQGLQEAAGGVRQILSQTTELATGLRRLAAGAGRLERGLGELERGALELQAGLARLASGGRDMQAGLAELGSGTSALASGVERLGGGAGQLEEGLSSGSGRVRQLRSGVDRMHDGVIAFRRRTDSLGSGLGRADELRPVFESGYLTVAALDGAPPQSRDAAGFLVNVDGGGSAARVTVIQRDGEFADRDLPLRRRIDAGAARVAERTGSEAAVGGAAPRLQDFDSTTTNRMPILIVALSLITYLVLIPILRSVLLPAIGVLLNVLTVFAAFGVLVIGFQGDAPLGGPGFLDAIMVMGIFAVIFGLSIDYQVFLLARMREGWLATRDTSGAIEYGLRKTAGVITGAALIMTGVFVAFSVTEIVSMRQFGIGLTVAVLIDATVVRLILLPAAMRLLGTAAWWMPAWLERLLPNVDLEASERPHAGDPLDRPTVALERA